MTDLQQRVAALEGPRDDVRSAIFAVRVERVAGKTRGQVYD
jgi:hypothetical protein